MKINTLYKSGDFRNIRGNIIFIVFLILIISFNCYSQQGWQILNTGANVNLYSIYFINTQTGFVGGGNGIILKTTNGGISWIQQKPGSNNPVMDISFINSNIGFAVSDSQLYKTTNSGIYWSVKSLNISVDIMRTVFFITASHGFVGGFRGTWPQIMVWNRTTNGGINWIGGGFFGTDVSSVNDIYFKNSNTGFITGSYYIYHPIPVPYYSYHGYTAITTNGGINWTWQSGSYKTGSLQKIAFGNDTNGIIVGYSYAYDYNILKTSNGGINWIQFVATENSSYKSISFSDSRTAHVINETNIFKTPNFGNTWYSIVNPSNQPINDITFVNSQTGYICGNNGVILKTTTGGIPTGFNHIGENIPNTHLLHQNFPNPFNPETYINYSIQKQGFVKLVVFDILGRGVAALVNSEMTAGNYQVVFDASGLNSGVYFYRITSGDFTDVKKMSVVK
ncbi:MAG: T9SS type A sorting domain-containing protein [Ignavibacteria bacterium]|nr:T9SS type A sorting domain-containing protein [Ignavibacteria bacterium]